MATRSKIAILDSLVKKPTDKPKKPTDKPKKPTDKQSGVVVEHLKDLNRLSVATAKVNLVNKKATNKPKKPTKVKTPKVSSSFDPARARMGEERSMGVGPAIIPPTVVSPSFDPGRFRMGEERSMGVGPEIVTPTVTTPSFDPARFRMGEENSMGVGPSSSAFTPPVINTSGALTPGAIDQAAARSGAARPAAAILAQQQYDADRAAAAAVDFARNAAARESFSQALMGARGGAADIYGGRAPALLGQAVTGAQRNLLTQQVADTIRNQADLEALRRAYSEAVGQAYSGLAQNALSGADRRSALAAQINRLGM